MVVAALVLKRRLGIAGYMHYSDQLAPNPAYPYIVNRIPLKVRSFALDCCQG